jgi:hypothetical protein
MKSFAWEQKRALIFVKCDKNERESKVFFAALRLPDNHAATAKVAAEADLSSVDHISYNQGAQPFIGSQLGDCGNQFGQGGSVATTRFRTVWFHGALQISSRYARGGIRPKDAGHIDAGKRVSL